MFRIGVRDSMAEPNYFREPFPTDDPVYFFDLESVLPRYCKAYRYDDDRRQRYDEYAGKLLEGTFGKGKEPRKSYMKRAGDYIIVTDPGQFVADYNEAVLKLQEWCRRNHITYRAIGAPDSRVYKVGDLYQSYLKYLERAEKVWEDWKRLRDFAREAVIGKCHIRTGRNYCSCSRDTEDDRYSWWIHLDSIGHIGEYRLAIETFFDAIENPARGPERLPDVYLRAYLTLESDDFYNPWANGEKTYPLRADQISDDCKEALESLVHGLIREFDRTHKRYRDYSGELSWGSNFFRILKEDFNPERDIRVVFQDGRIGRGETPEEKVRKFAEVLEAIEGAAGQRIAVEIP